MQNMWNTINNNLLFMGHKQLFGPNTTQKKHFGYDFPNVGNIGVGKSFNNPNFVNKDYPKIHNYQRTDQLDSSTSPCQIDSKRSPITFSGEAYINSSQSIIETIKEKHLDIVQPIHNTSDHLDLNKDLILQTITEISSEIPCKDKPVMCKKRTRKNRRRPRKAHSFKNSEKSKKQEINDMMEVDYESQMCSNPPDISMSPNEHHALTLSDFLCNKNSLKNEDADINIQIDEEDVETDSIAFISNYPCMESKFKRERTVSLAESEDSFIVFESGTDDELEFSDTSQEGDDSEEETDEDELDSSPSVVPRKKVRFADDSELCQIHPMIMWSYAYQKARIGPWQKYAIDRVRFKDHIRDLEEKIKPVLDSKHRETIFKERFHMLELPVG